MGSSDQFAKWFIKLGARARNLQAQVSDTDVSALEREANICEAMLQHLYDYAVQHHIDSSQFYPRNPNIREIRVPPEAYASPALDQQKAGHQQHPPSAANSQPSPHLLLILRTLLR